MNVTAHKVDAVDCEDAISEDQCEFEKGRAELFVGGATNREGGVSKTTIDQIDSGDLEREDAVLKRPPRYIVIARSSCCRRHQKIRRGWRRKRQGTGRLGRRTEWHHLVGNISCDFFDSRSPHGEIAVTKVEDPVPCRPWHLQRVPSLTLSLFLSTSTRRLMLLVSDVRMLGGKKVQFLRGPNIQTPGLLEPETVPGLVPKRAESHSPPRLPVLPTLTAKVSPPTPSRAAPPSDTRDSSPPRAPPRRSPHRGRYPSHRQVPAKDHPSSSSSFQAQVLGPEA